MRRAWVSLVALAVAAGAGTIPLACSSSSTPPKKSMTVEDLRNPDNCKDCHSLNYETWARSMHAYASDDPVFLAMNARGQRETNGALGSFCVQCHAPMAVRDNLTKDGTNLASLSKAEKGVTCYFCHSIDSVGASHVNADLNLATDGVMRASLTDAKDNPAHNSAYSKLQDHKQPESAAMCGTCHDIVAPPGGHIERTFQEWSSSIFSTSATTCAFNGTCHMAATTQMVPIATGGPSRIFHPHDFPAVDIAFDPNFPEPGAQEQTVQTALKTVLQGGLCVNSRGGIRVILDNAGAAHSWPSGSAQDRRVWVEVNAYKAGALIYSSGNVPPGTPVGPNPADPDLWQLRDQMFDTNGQPVSMFWQAACAKGNELGVAASNDPTNAANYTHRTRLYPNTPSADDSALDMMPDRVVAKVHMQPIGLDVLNDLVDSGDLDPSVAAQMPTLTVALPAGVDAGAATDPDVAAGALVWTPEAAAVNPNNTLRDYTQDQLTMMSCVTTEVFSLVVNPTASDPPTTCPAMAAAAPDAGP